MFTEKGMELGKEPILLDQSIKQEIRSETELSGREIEYKEIWVALLEKNKQKYPE